MSEPNDEIELDIQYDIDDWNKGQETYDDMEEEIDWMDY